MYANLKLHLRTDTGTYLCCCMSISTNGCAYVWVWGLVIYSGQMIGNVIFVIVLDCGDEQQFHNQLNRSTAGFQAARKSMSRERWEI